MPAAVPWPSWAYFPQNTRPPEWATDFVADVTAARESIDTTQGSATQRSDVVLAALAAPLTARGYAVESGKTRALKIARPVLFGENGASTVNYEIDAVHDSLGVVVEVEAGRGAVSNATYRNLIRASLIVDAKYLALVMPIHYRPASATSPTLAYRDARETLAAIHASRRLSLPFDGVLLVGY